MAGLGTKLFLQGDTLSADEVNGYLMSQAVTKFATAAARDSAFGDGIPVSLGGSGKPSLSSGMVCFVQFQADGITALNRIQYYDGTQWQDSDQFFVGDGLITTAKLADSAVTTAKILDSNVTTAKLASGPPQAGFRSVQNAATTASNNYTIQLSDLGKLVELNEASACTLTVPTNASVAFAVGDRIDVLQVGAGQVTITPVSGTVTINGYDGGLKLNGQWAAATLIKRATNTWVAVGNLTT